MSIKGNAGRYYSYLIKEVFEPPVSYARVLICMFALVLCGCGTGHGIEGTYRTKDRQSTLYLKGTTYFLESIPMGSESGTYVQDGDKIRCQPTDHGDPMFPPSGPMLDDLVIGDGGDTLTWTPRLGQTHVFVWDAPASL
jgi:hypothetical protein